MADKKITDLNALTTADGTNDLTYIHDNDVDELKKITIDNLLATQHDHTESDITDLDHNDTNAIHNDVGGEIDAISDKATPVDADILLIEDSEDSSIAKKKVTIANLLATSHEHEEAEITDLDHNDTNALHDNIGGEINAITTKAVPVTADILLMEDSEDSSLAKKKMTVAQLLALGETDTTAIHDNVGGEIDAIDEKTDPIGADILLIEDSEDSSIAKKKVLLTNLPSIASQTNLIKNSRLGVWSNSTLADYSDANTGFSALHPEDNCTDPDNDVDVTTGWTANDDAVLSSEAGGDTGNCLKILENGTANPDAWVVSISITKGKLYRLTLKVKQGDEATWKAYLQATGFQYGWTTNQESTGSWVEHTFVFVAGVTQADAYITLTQVCAGSAGTYILFDDVALSEVIPACVGADAKAMDNWTKDTTIDIYRDADTVKDGSLYSVKCAPSAIWDFVSFPSENTASPATNEEWHKQFAGRQIAFGVWIKSSTASDVRITIQGKQDNSDNTTSDYHTGGGDWEWLELTKLCSSSIDTLTIMIINANASPGTYSFCQPMLIFGYVIGSGNYVPIVNESIYFENEVLSNLLDALSANSDVAFTGLNLEADSNGAIPKDVSAIYAKATGNDSGSAGTDSYFALRKNSDLPPSFICSSHGLANDTYARKQGWIPCDNGAVVDYRIEATGSATFDIQEFEYYGVKLS